MSVAASSAATAELNSEWARDLGRERNTVNFSAELVQEVG